jgi:hypothetical protein
MQAQRIGQITRRNGALFRRDILQGHDLQCQCYERAVMMTKLQYTIDMAGHWIIAHPFEAGFMGICALAVGVLWEVL